MHIFVSLYSVFRCYFYNGGRIHIPGDRTHSHCVIIASIFSYNYNRIVLIIIFFLSSSLFLYLCVCAEWYSLSATLTTIFA